MLVSYINVSSNISEIMKQQRKNRIRFLILLGMLCLISVVCLQFQCNKFGSEENLSSFGIGLIAIPDKDSVSVKQKGMYSILFSNAVNVYRANDNCTKASFTLHFENTNKHNCLNPFFTGEPTPIRRDYNFKVN